MPMPKDKYSAVWVSHSSIGDFLVCPRAYFLKNVYRDPTTNHKISLVSPPLALGQTVHEVLESLSVIPVDKRFDDPLTTKFDAAWKKVSGDLGGFPDKATELAYKKKGQDMITRVVKNPGPLKNLAIKINQDLPYYWLSEEDNIILCGKIDWLEFIKDSDSVHIIDFKTGKYEESPDSLQLPIYLLLATNTQNRPVAKVSYWYLERNDAPKEQALPNMDKSKDQVLEIAKQMSLARKLNRFKCPHNGCRNCKPYEAILEGKAKFVGVGGFGQDLYILFDSSNKSGTLPTSQIL